MKIEDVRQFIWFITSEDENRQTIPCSVLRHRFPAMTVPTNPTQLAAALDVTQQSVQGWYASGLPAGHGDKLANWCGFDEGPLRTSYDNDDLAAFKKKYRDYWIERLKEAKAIEPHSPPGRLVDLVEDTAFIDPDRKKTDIAMLAVFVPTNAPPVATGEAYVSFTLNCPPMRDVGFTCGVRAGWLEFDLGQGMTTHAKERRGFGSAALIENGHFTVHDPDFHTPVWFVEAVTGPCIGMVGDVPADFLLARQLAPDAVIRACFRVCVSDGGVSFTLPDGKAEKPAKAKLKQRLKTLQILGENDGKATVAAIAAKLIAKPYKANGDVS